MEVPITVRVPKPMLEDIEAFVKARPIKTARHTWLMEAIYEKWKREKEHAL
jgi:Arc/MetJ-type ribon-helix-helix transcriptional regulator